MAMNDNSTSGNSTSGSWQSPFVCRTYGTEWTLDSEIPGDAAAVELVHEVEASAPPGEGALATRRTVCLSPRPPDAPLKSGELNYVRSVDAVYDVTVTLANDTSPPYYVLGEYRYKLAKGADPGVWTLPFTFGAPLLIGGTSLDGEGLQIDLRPGERARVTWRGMYCMSNFMRSWYFQARGVVMSGDITLHYADGHARPVGRYGGSRVCALPFVRKKVGDPPEVGPTVWGSGDDRLIVRLEHRLDTYSTIKF